MFAAFLVVWTAAAAYGSDSVEEGSIGFSVPDGTTGVGSDGVLVSVAAGRAGAIPLIAPVFIDVGSQLPLSVVPTQETSASDRASHFRFATDGLEEGRWYLVGFRRDQVGSKVKIRMGMGAVWETPDFVGVRFRVDEAAGLRQISACPKSDGWVYRFELSERVFGGGIEGARLNRGSATLACKSLLVPDQRTLGTGELVWLCPDFVDTAALGVSIEEPLLTRENRRPFDLEGILKGSWTQGRDGCLYFSSERQIGGAM